jgi:hypothetical protein
MPAVTERAKARHRKRRRTSYHHSNPRAATTFRIEYRAKGLSDGQNALCPTCGKRYTWMDFKTDLMTGQLVEPDLCSRCAG